MPDKRILVMIRDQLLMFRGFTVDSLGTFSLDELIKL